MATVDRLDTKQQIVPTRKARKKKTLKATPRKKRHKSLKNDNKGKGKTDMTKIKCFNCGETDHYSRNCPKPRENANLSRENEQSSKFAERMDFGDNSICEECAMICTDVYSDEEYQNLKVYGDQGISTKTYDEETYGDLLTLTVMKIRPLSIMWPYAYKTVCHWRKTKATEQRHTQ